MDDMHGSKTTIPQEQYRLSWVAYVRPVVLFLLFGALSVFMMTVDLRVGIPFLIAVTGWLIYSVLSLKSIVLFMDEEGVWIHSGILPWNRGFRSVRWRDLDVAEFFPNFVSWACNAYLVRVGHRFTKASELLVHHVHNGRELVHQINAVHSEWVGLSEPPSRQG
ncbi:hypothetical protein [Alloalcanivorax xenomutans]|uniref:hypothetical protein n=1 Tax=Alloalcanivorax xenomutans TaxID=1094342 RepID=UPI000C10DE30|nr:hypothetical protein [Alloalcanivorax xenomutans]MCE7525747.1 hypothetical protein [Alloalcanivorax xenomutans]PHS67236.1 MAG: hypothetical protein COB00_09135 [Alcanivorax sp.]PHS73060.1 MAG: hypothetical protein COB00_00270 [Alcanivorax sp.]